MGRIGYASLIGLALLAMAPCGTALAADGAKCESLSQQFDARRASLEPPQISATLFAAAEDGCEALVSRLIEDGASVAARDREGGTALTHAARGGHAAVLELLLSHGAEIDRRMVDGATALFVAAKQNRLRPAEVLLEHGANPNIAGPGGVTPLGAAAFGGSLKLVDFLLQHGADPTLQDLSGKVPVLYAAARGFQPLVARLMATGGDINAAYGNKLTLLMWAAGHANDVPVEDGVRLVTMLLDKGASLDAQDDRGRTALMIAAELGHGEIVDLLLRRGARPEARDLAGKTAADLALSEDIRTRLTLTR